MKKPEGENIEIEMIITMKQHLYLVKVNTIL
jgi:hypothetical protein